MTAPHRIDVHHHPSPPSYLKARSGREGRYPAQENWTAAKSLEDMERGGVATSVLSLPHSVHIWPEDLAEARRLAREWNEFMAKLARDYPGRFGVFAALPILDIEGSLRELEYALDTLEADGIALMTNIGDKWLGDPHYAPVFEELDRRKALVYTHPIAPDCCRGILPEFNDAVIEYGTDTTRAIAKLVFSGSAARYPHIRFIFSHAGGTLPFIAERFLRAHLHARADVKAKVPDGVIAAFNKLYYDTAQASHPYAMSSITRLVSVSQLVFGTDFPYRSAEEHVRGLAGCGFSDTELRAIDCENAQRLMPRWRKK
jgi:predicted TIM-barrel fold metal-dependent hydrolase